MKKFIVFFFLLIFSQLKIYANDVIKVGFLIDNNYPVFTMIAIDSILQNNTSKSKYKFYIFENNISKFNKWQMKRFVKNRNQDIEFISVNTDIIDSGRDFYQKEFQEEVSVNINRLKHVSKIAEVRLYLAEILKKEDKLLYLDGDIIVTTDLKPLWEYDLNGNVVAMGDDIFKYMKKLFNGKPYEYSHYPYDTYYNAGVILMDLKKMREEGWCQRLVDEFNKHPEYHFHDQDVINIVLHNNIQRFPEKWNMQVDKPWPLTIKPRKGIYHYIGKWKPWVFNQRTYFIRHYKTYQRLYMSYWEKSYLKIYIPYYMIKALPKLYADCINIEIEMLKARNRAKKEVQERNRLIRNSVGY